jgi:hypothetical protein
MLLAYKYSKGWFLAQLKAKGITKHPAERRKLESYKTYVVRKLYEELIESDSKSSSL